MTRPKPIIALLLAVLALAVGLYASGWLALVFMKLDTGTLKASTWWNYMQLLDHPRMQPFAGRVKLAGAIGFGLPALAWLVLAVLLYRFGHGKYLHGKARFAHMGDLAGKGFLKSSSNGIVIGKKHGKLLRLSGQQFAILAAPTRSGKGVGVVIPNLLDYGESVVVLDIKQENFDLTSGWRAQQGQEIYLFNPFADDRRTHRWNPLSYVSTDPAFRVSDLMGIATMLYPDGDDKDKFWTSQARNAFMAFSLYLFEEAIAHGPGAPKPTLGRIYRLSSDTGGMELKPYLEKLSQSPFLSDNARTAFAGLLSQADVTFASIMGSFKEPLNAWINPVLDAATSGDDFRLDDVRKRKMTIYIGIQPNRLAESRLIVNLFFSQLINVNTRELPQNNPELKHQCLLLMDEFTSLGRVEIISKAVAYMAGYNLRLLPIIQSMAQLDAVYGKELSRTIITNHALQIIYAPREQQDANDYSEMLGYTTVHRKNRTRSRGQGSNTSFSESQEKRALMLPQELKAMGPDKEIILYEGLPHPVKCDKIRYYKDAYFTRRLKPKVEVKPLNLEENTPMKGKTAGIVAASALALLGACATPQAPHPEQGTTTQYDGRPLDPADWADWAADRAAAEVAAEEAAYRAANPNPPPRPPGPAAGFPPAPTVPSIPAARLRADLLRLLGSIQALEDANRPHVETIMGVKMGKPEGTESFFEYYGSVDEGWKYSATVWPRDDRPNSTIHFHLGAQGWPVDKPTQCTFDVDVFLAELKNSGWEVDDTPGIERTGLRYLGFVRQLPEHNIQVGGSIYFYPLRTDSATGTHCISGLEINAGSLKDNA